MKATTSLANHLGHLAPVFRARAEQISFLSSPGHFYETIVEQVAMARRRISLATLYLGSEELERRLVAQLGERLQTPGQDDLKVHIHMDYLRGTRGFPGLCSASMLRPLLSSGRLQVSMYLTPTLQGPSWRRLIVPPRWNEIFGLSHLKVCVFDDTVLITGANLSQSYFTNRTDRYVCIKEHPLLADYFVELLQTIASFSFHLRPSEMENKMLQFDEPSISISRAQEAITNFSRRHQEKIPGEKRLGEGDALLIPSIQMAPHSIRQDERLLESLINWYNQKHSDAQCSLASGYFNLAPLAQHIFRQADRLGRNPWQVLTSSPATNGFYKSAGFSQYIPDAYRSIEYAFLSQEHPDRPNLVLNERGQSVIYEYERADWTFHAKGLWLDDPTMTATVIGSSNFGHRSFDRDLEAQLTIATGNQNLAKEIRKERDDLFAHGSLVSKEDILRIGLPSFSVRAASKLFRSYL